MPSPSSTSPLVDAFVLERIAPQHGVQVTAFSRTQMRVFLPELSAVSEIAWSPLGWRGFTWWLGYRPHRRDDALVGLAADVIMANREPTGAFLIADDAVDDFGVENFSIATMGALGPHSNLFSTPLPPGIDAAAAERVLFRCVEHMFFACWQEALDDIRQQVPALHVGGFLLSPSLGMFGEIGTYSFRVSSAFHSSADQVDVSPRSEGPVRGPGWWSASVPRDREYGVPALRFLYALPSLLSRLEETPAGYVFDVHSPTGELLISDYHQMDPHHPLRPHRCRRTCVEQIRSRVEYVAQQWFATHSAGVSCGGQVEVRVREAVRDYDVPGAPVLVAG